MSPSRTDSSGAHASRVSLEERFLRDRVRALYAQSSMGIVVGFVLAFVFTPLFWHQVQSLWICAWFAAMLLCCATGAWAQAHFNRVAAQQNDWPTNRLLHLFTAQGWFKAALLGWMGWLFYSPDFGDLRWATVLTVCAMAAGTVTAYAYHLPTYWGFLALMCLPLWLRMALTGGMGGWASHAVFAAYLLALAGFAGNQAKVLLESIRIRHENNRLVQQLRRRTQDLEAANESKARFFAAASHDLRQPLHALGFYTGLLRPHAEDAPHVERIHQCVDSLDGLLEGVMTISRLDSGRVERHLEPVNLQQLLRRMATLYGGLALSRGLQLRTRWPAEADAGLDECWAQSDPVLLERVLGNLLNNALRYTTKGGVLLALRKNLSGWQIRIADTGMGIAQQEQTAVFDEFVQLNNPQRDAAQGVGLGLATVRRMCALLEHPLALRSELGRGSVFSVCLPAVQKPPSATASPAVVSDTLQGRLLLVEDDPHVRESLAHTLMLWGLQVTLCSNAEEGLAALCAVGTTDAPSSPVFDVLLSDWRLGGSIDGLAFLTQASALPAQARSLRLLMTGEPPEAVGPMPTGVSLLRKPVKPLRLRALLSAYFSAPRQP